MSRLEVTFADSVLAAEQQYQVDAVLRRIGTVGPGRWPLTVNHIHVVKVFGGGRSDGQVLAAELWLDGNARLAVIKIDAVHALRGEWRGWKEIEPRRNALFAPVLAATPEVADAALAPTGKGALVYSDAAAHAGEPGIKAWALEEIVADPTRTAEAVAAVQRLLGGVRPVLHTVRRINPDISTLIELNPTLGPNLDIHAHDGPATEVLPLEVLHRSTTGLSGDLVTGERIAVDVESDRAVRITVDGRPARAARGVVVISRGPTRRAELVEALGARLDEHGLWWVGDLAVADPFAALLDVLTKPVRGRVTSLAHGDLNARNILVVADRPFLIDYAQAGDGHPQQFDFCWLEVALMRDVFAERDFAELVRVQRALAVASRLLDLGVDAATVLTECRPLAGGGAFDVLFEIRKLAHDCYPREAEPEWRRDHLGHLLLSAHRTLKWSGDAQSPAKLRAVAAVASVVTEWLTDSDPFQHWDRDVSTARSLLRTHLGKVLAARVHVDRVDYVELDADEVSEPSREQVPMPIRTPKVEQAPQPTRVQQLLSQHPFALLTGGRGSGKSYVLREFAHRLAQTGSAPVPLLVRATDLAAAEPSLLTPENDRFGVVHLLIDDLDELGVDAGRELLASLRGRYPGTRILACAGTAGDLPPEFRHIRLRELDERSVEWYLRRHLSEADVDQLLFTLFDDPSWVRLDIRRPASLSMLVRYVERNGRPEAPHDPHKAMLLAKAGGERELLLAAETVARALDGEDVVPDPRFERSDWDHLAALALLHRVRKNPAAVTVRASRPAWREALIVFVTLPEVPAISVAAAVSAASDPALAGRLLAATPAKPAKELHRFVTEQQAALRAGGTLAANALCELGDPSTLAAVVMDAETSDDGRICALTYLASLRERMRPGREHRAATWELIRATRDVLSGTGTPKVTECALKVIAEAHLHQFGLLVADYVDPSRDWRVTRQAMQTLHALDVLASDRVLRAYQLACLDRLADSDALLRATTAADEAFVLQWERVSLLDAIRADDRRTWLLRLRFGFDIASEIEEIMPYRPPAGDPGDWLDLVETGTPEQAADAAHHLLILENGYPDRILDRMSERPGRDRVLIAAAAVRKSTVDRAEQLLLGLLPDVSGEDLEGPAALLVAIHRLDRPRGVRLAPRAARVLIDRDLPERHFWPWRAALARCRDTGADFQ